MIPLFVVTSNIKTSHTVNEHHRINTVPFELSTKIQTKPPNFPSLIIKIRVWFYGICHQTSKENYRNTLPSSNSPKSFPFFNNSNKNISNIENNMYSYLKTKQNNSHFPYKTRKFKQKISFTLTVPNIYPTPYPCTYRP